jgi:hypothetical protein
VNEYRSTLERAGSNAPPADLALERVLRRRERKRRNQRITAGVVGIAVFVAAVWVLGARLGGETTNPAKPPMVVPGETKALEVAKNFFAAYGAFDADRAITYLADDADLSGIGADGIREFRLLLSYLEAVEYRQLHTSCLDVGSSALETYVHCTYDFHSNGSDQIGRGPYSGTSIHFTVRDGKIVRASMYWELGKYASQMWYPFKEWVSTNYPKDVAVMYDDTYAGDYALTPNSIRLWKRHTREYVEQVGR